MEGSPCAFEVSTGAIGGWVESMKDPQVPVPAPVQQGASAVPAFPAAVHPELSLKRPSGVVQLIPFDVTLQLEEFAPLLAQSNEKPTVELNPAFSSSSKNGEALGMGLHIEAHPTPPVPSASRGEAIRTSSL